MRAVGCGVVTTLLVNSRPRPPVSTTMTPSTAGMPRNQPSGLALWWRVGGLHQFAGCHDRQDVLVAEGQHPDRKAQTPTSTTLLQKWIVIGVCPLSMRVHSHLCSHNGHYGSHARNRGLTGSSWPSQSSKPNFLATERDIDAT